MMFQFIVKIGMVTKLLSDAYIQLKSDNYLLIRCTHKSEPFPYEKAWTNQIGNFDYVSVISDLIIKLINNNATGVYNVGTTAKTIYQLAKKTNKNVKPTQNFINNTTPANVTMDLSKIKKFLKGK